MVAGHAIIQKIDFVSLHSIPYVGAVGITMARKLQQERPFMTSLFKYFIVGFLINILFTNAAINLPGGIKPPVIDPSPDINPPPIINPPPVFDPLAPVARFEWEMDQRFFYGWLFFDKDTRRYHKSYVFPKGYVVYLDASATTPGVYSGARIASYSWEIRDETGDMINSFKTASPQIGKVPASQEFKSLAQLLLTETDIARREDLLLDRLLQARPGIQSALKFPRTGKYQVKLRVTNSRGGSAEKIQQIILTDHLIVSAGDSFASGEGNPDLPINADLAALLDSQRYAEYFREILRATNRWQDVVCHRSTLNSHSLAAAKIESRDPHGAVTFLSYACSGDRTRELLNWLQELKSNLSESSPTRPVDALIISIGGNDVGFVDILTKCALPTVGVDCRSVIKDYAKRLSNGSLEAQYDKIANFIEMQLPVRETYIVEYPTSLFNSDVDKVIEKMGIVGDVIEFTNWDSLTEAVLSGVEDLVNGIWCGITELFGQKCEKVDLLAECGIFSAVNNSEAVMIHLLGRRLNGLIKTAAEKHKWNYITGVAKAFKRHSYCDRDSWFVSFGTSVTQPTLAGTMHPNFSGHRAVAEILTRDLYFGPVPQKNKRVKVTFTDVRVDDTVAQRIRGEGSVSLDLNGRSDKSYEWAGVAKNLHFGPKELTVLLYHSPVPPRLRDVTNLTINVTGYFPRKALDLDGFGTIYVPREFDWSKSYETETNYGIRSALYQQEIAAPFGKLVVSYKIEDAPTTIIPDHILDLPVFIPVTETRAIIEDMRNPRQLTIRKGNEPGSVTISWKADEDGDYSLQTSGDLVTWSPTPKGLFKGLKRGSSVEFTEAFEPSASNQTVSKFYRLRVLKP